MSSCVAADRGVTRHCSLPGEARRGEAEGEGEVREPGDAGCPALETSRLADRNASCSASNIESVGYSTGHIARADYKKPPDGRTLTNRLLSFAARAVRALKAAL